MAEENWKWQKLLWAMVFALSIYLLIRVLFVKLHEGLGFYPYFFLGWWINIPLGILALGLRVLKAFKNRNFLYILIGMSNLLMGILDIYFITYSTDIGIQLLLIALLPLAFSIFIVIDFSRQKK